MKRFLTTILLSLLFFTRALASDQSIVRVDDRESGKFLALLPINFNISARAYPDGTVEMDYPWYSFLTVTKKDKLEAEMKVAVDNTLRSSLVGSVRASGEPAERIFTEREVRQVAEAMQEVLKENLPNENTGVE